MLESDERLNFAAINFNMMVIQCSCQGVIGSQDWSHGTNQYEFMALVEILKGHCITGKKRV